MGKRGTQPVPSAHLANFDKGTQQIGTAFDFAFEGTFSPRTFKKIGQITTAVDRFPTMGYDNPNKVVQLRTSSEPGIHDHSSHTVLDSFSGYDMYMF